MPIYEYKCKKGHVFDVMQSFSDEPLTKCEVCGAPVQKVFHPISVHFKGSGFYNTDYGTKRRAREKENSKESSSSSSSESNGSKSDSSSDSSSSASKSESSSSGSSRAQRRPRAARPLAPDRAAPVCRVGPTREPLRLPTVQQLLNLVVDVGLAGDEHVLAVVVAAALMQRLRLRGSADLEPR